MHSSSIYREQVGGPWGSLGGNRLGGDLFWVMDEGTGRKGVSGLGREILRGDASLYMG